ncbi:SHOCT domain-containing protein [Paenibacillus silviterrae]
MSYSMQLAMLSKLLKKGIISEQEYTLFKLTLMKDYKIYSDSITLT